jgi:hypothetical protein
MRSYRTLHDVANECRLKRTQHHGSFLLVEGPDDSRFYKRFIDNHVCHVVVASNKENVVGAISLLDDEGFTGAIGAIDSDFDALEGKLLPSTNLVRPSGHDLETMLVESPALEAVLHEYSSPEKLEEFEGRGSPVREWLVSTALWIGYLRWHSLQSGLNLSFDGLRHSRFLDGRTLELDPEALVTELKNRSQAPAIPADQLCEAGCPMGRAEDPWHVCCGHDMVELLTFALRRCIGSQLLALEDVGRSLRLAYGAADFARSTLRAAMSEWEDHSGFRVLARQ